VTNLPDDERVIRKSTRNAARDAANLISGVFVAESLSPSAAIWLVSPWISDMVVIDNRGSTFSSLYPDIGDREIRLGECLVRLAAQGTQITIAARPDDLNARFFRAVSLDQSDRILIRHEADLHDKTLLGDDYLVTGSMNFTYKGITENEENVTFTRDEDRIARARTELRARWN
jgi:phosphatidylserine/phosphatidylglycerophosphate/cardiolipin synthase-like enzyme